MKERLGWVGFGSSPPVATVEADGSYWVEPLESTPAGGAKVLKILKSIDPLTGARSWYYLESRQAIGVDGFLASYPNVLGGMVIRTGSESSGNTSNLLDMTPETTSWTDPALLAGATFTDPDAGLAITPVSVGTTGALVNVTFTGLPCFRSNPMVTLSSTGTAGVAPGTPVTYAVSVTSNDGAGCSPSDFSLSAQAPSGWSAILGLPHFQVAPGATASTTLEAISALAADAGSYAIEVTATSSTDLTISGTASAEYLVADTGLPCIRANPMVTLSSTETTGVAPGTPVTYAVSVTSNDGAGCSASDFSLSAQVPSGWSTALALPKLQVAPGASASTTLEVISASTADAGSYAIEVTATSSTDLTIVSTASAEYLVAIPISVQVSIDQTRKQRVRIYVATSLGQSAAGGANVALTITRPDGTRVEASLVANGDGVADYALRVRRKDPVGTYDVAAVVSFEGASGVGGTSFIVN